MTGKPSSPAATGFSSSATGFCSGCGRPMREADHGECERRQQATDPPRFCTACGRKLVVQVLPVGWRARCVRCGEVSF